MTGLAHRLNGLCDASPFRAAFVCRDLRGGQAVRRNADTIFNAASVRKISILAAALAAAEQGRMRLEEPLRMETRHQANDSGCLQHLTPGLALPLRDALMLMIIVSDSTATAMVTEALTLEAVNAYCGRIGLAKTFHRFGATPAGYGPGSAKNLTTVSDTSLLLETLLRGCSDPVEAERLELTPALCGLAMDMLAAQRIRDRLPALLPEGVKTAHKTGLDYDCVHDAGVVFGREDDPLFLLAVFLDHVPETLPGGQPGKASARRLIARLSRLCYDFFSRPGHCAHVHGEAFFHAQSA